MDEPLDPEDRLHGWKAIGQFLGRSARAVQRWEAELGLPVHRITTERGHTVYASRKELTAWLVQVDRSRLSPDPELEGEQNAVGSIVAKRFRPSPALLVVVASLVVIVSGISALSLISDNQGKPVSSITIQGRTLEARDESGTVLWRANLSEDGGRLLGGRYYRPNPLRTDLDGDGRNEVIVALSFGRHENDIGTGHQLLCFSTDGKFLWSYRGDQRFQFGGRVFDGPSRFTAWMSDGIGNVWVSVNHHTWWPTAIVKLDHRGRAELRYVHSGAIYAMTTWNVGTRRLLALGGINNEYAAASVSVIDADGARATSPQSKGTEFYCDTCPRRGPEAFYVFPRTDIHRSTGRAYANVNDVIAAGHLLKVITEEYSPAAGLHFIDDSLQVRESKVSDHFDTIHDDLTRQGLLDHPARLCPEKKRIQQVGVWINGEWLVRPVVEAPLAMGLIR